jgi:hypothetical protein
MIGAASSPLAVYKRFVQLEKIPLIEGYSGAENPGVFAVGMREGRQGF